MKIFLNVSPSKVANSFLQQFLVQQEPALERARVLFVRNQFKDEHPHYWLKKTLFEAIREGRTDRGLLDGAAERFLALADPDRFDMVYHLLSGLLYGDPMVSSVDAVARGFEVLRTIFEDFDVHLFTAIRRQDKFLESFYIQKIQRGQSLSFAEYMEAVDMDQISWDRLLLAAEGLFGPDHVHVLPFETIYAGEIPFLRACVSPFADPDAFDYGQLDELIKNRSYSEVALTIARTANPLLNDGEQRTLRAFLQQHFSNLTHPRPKLLDAALSREILARHLEGNRAVFARHCPDADMAAMGYLPE